MAEDLDQLLDKLSRLDIDDPQEFELQAIQLFNNHVDIESTNLYYQPVITHGDRQIRPDGMIARSRNDKPVLILEAKLTRREIPRQSPIQWSRQVLSFVEMADAEYGVILSNQFFTILNKEKTVDIELANPSQKDINQAKKILNSVSVPDESKPIRQVGPRRNQRIDAKYFSLNLNEFDDAVQRLDDAESTNEKGEAFENLAELLLGGIDFLTVRDKQLRTKTGEIDIVIEYDGYNQKTIFDEYSRFILAECKNWNDTVGVAQVRDFKGKMDKSYTDFGILFSREGISGDGGADAVRWIHDYFQREGSVILVIDDDEISRILSGESFYEILDDLLYKQRFDLSFS